jgi:CheY-like chemotaxis protein
MRILVVDDEMEILSLLKDSLEDEGLTEEEEDFIIWDENNQREDLNLYDKVRFHLRFIKRTFNFNDDKEAISFILNCHFYKKQEDASRTSSLKFNTCKLFINDETVL